MLRFKLLLIAVPFLAIQPLLASTVQVGGCLPNLQNFSTISEAVSSVPAGSTVQVCPGTYAEQVTIMQPLTLQGINVGDANLALITVPSAGLLPNTTSIFGESVAAQILVLGAAPVNIDGIAVDGTGGDMACSSNLWVAGIFYGSGSSGTISRVRTSGQVDGSCGVGIWAENGDSSSQSVTIRSSTVYNVDSSGIFVGSGATPTLNATVLNNVVSASAAVAGIDTDGVRGGVQGNVLSNSVFGVYNASTLNVSLNTIVGATYGIYMGVGGGAVNNQITGASYGAMLGENGATISSNHIMSSTTAAVEFSCFTATVTKNFIVDAGVAYDQVPGGSIPAKWGNSSSDAATGVTGGCATASTAARSFRAMTTRSQTNVNQRSQWHTPATPFGTRTK
jgi:hypothetical protein